MEAIPFVRFHSTEVRQPERSDLRLTSSLAQKGRLQDFLTPLPEAGRTRVFRASQLRAVEAAIFSGIHIHQPLRERLAGAEPDQLGLILVAWHRVEADRFA